MSGPSPLLRGSISPSACPASDRLAGLVLGQPCAAKDRTALLDHLAHCPECGAIVAALIRADAEEPDPSETAALPRLRPAARGALARRLASRSVFLRASRWLAREPRNRKN